MSEELWDLPDGWAWASFSDVADVELDLVDGKRFPDALHIAPNHVESGTARLLDVGTVAGDKVQGPQHRFRKGQILYSKIRPYLAKAVLAPGDGLCSSDMYPVNARPGMDAQFLLRWLVSPAFTQRAAQSQGRTVLPKVNLATLREFPVPVPPGPEQRRIVTKLEDLLARSRRAKEALDAIPPLLEKLRQSILAAAFRGDLTAEWRAQHPDVETAEKLLARIRVERRKKWEEAELAKLRAKGKAPTDDRWKAKYKEPEPVDTDGLPELPEGWAWASLDEVLVALRNGIAVKPAETSGLRILRISAVRPLDVNVNDVRYLHDAGDFADYLLSNGDLLLTRYNGNPDLVGVAGIVRGLVAPTVYPDKLIRAVPVDRVVAPEFLQIVLNAGVTRAHIAERGKSAAGQVGVSGADLRSAPIPVPPFDEQGELVRRVGAAIDLGRRFARALAALDANQLDAALLSKAFRGDLVPQDPNDEPLNTMLARLRATSEPASAAPPVRSVASRRAVRA